MYHFLRRKVQIYDVDGKPELFPYATSVARINRRNFASFNCKYGHTIEVVCMMATNEKNFNALMNTLFRCAHNNEVEEIYFELPIEPSIRRMALNFGFEDVPDYSRTNTVIKYVL